MADEAVTVKGRAEAAAPKRSARIVEEVKEPAKPAPPSRFGLDRDPGPYSPVPAGALLKENFLNLQAIVAHTQHFIYVHHLGESGLKLLALGDRATAAAGAKLPKPRKGKKEKDWAHG